MSDIVNANILFIAAMYVNFIGSLSRNLYFKYVIKVIKAAFYVLAFYYLGGVTGVVFYSLYMLNILFQTLHLSKYTLTKIFFTILTVVAFIFFKEYHVIDIIMYLLFISFFWVRAFIKKTNTLTKYRLVKKSIIAVYAYMVSAYALAIYELSSVIFYFVSDAIKKLTDYTNKKTS